MDDKNRRKAERSSTILFKLAAVAFNERKQDKRSGSYLVGFCILDETAPIRKRRTRFARLYSF